MSLRLRAGLSWCLCVDQVVFMDLVCGIYFALPRNCDMLFRHWAEGHTIEAARLTPLVERGLLEPGDEPPGTQRCTGQQYPRATRDLAHRSRSASRRIDVLAALAGQLLARRELRTRSVAQVINRSGPHRVRGSGRDTEAQARRVTAAFQASSFVLRPADQCLPRAVAARQSCNRRGVSAAIVFGVRMDPFSAHCWVQRGDAIIVGDLEQSSLYTPILVLP